MAELVLYRDVLEALDLWQALVGFCHEELLLEPETLLKVWLEPMLLEIEKLKNLPREAEEPSGSA
jgi:hypothetical protein